MNGSHPFGRFAKVLRNRNFAFLWSGQAVSQIGDSIFHIAIIWLVVELTGSSLAVGTMMIASQVPRLALQAFGGVIVDRVDRRRIMLSADILRGATVFLFAILVITGTVQLWHVYILAAMFGLVGAFFGPAQTALIPTIVGQGELVSATALNSLTFQANNIIGPALGGLLISLARVGVGGVSLLNALSFLVGALGIWLISVPRQRQASSGESVWYALVQGMRYMRSDSVILTAGCLAALASFVVGPMMVLMPLFAKEVLNTGAQGYGFMQGGVAAGFMTGTIIVGAIGKVRHRGPYALTMCLLSGVFIALFALSKDLGTATGALFAFGGADAMISVVMMAFLQERVADEFRGRIFSLLMLLASGLTPISMGLAGGLADQFGLVPVMLASGLGIAAIACGGFFLRDMRTLD